MLYHLRIQPSEIERLPEGRIWALIDATRQIREEIRKDKARNGG